MNKISKFKIIFIFSSFLYLIGGIIDFYATMDAYYIYGELFYKMEANEKIIIMLQNGIPPLYMLILPIIEIILVIYLCKNIKEKDLGTIYLFCLAMGMLFILGISHILSGLTWYL